MIISRTPLRISFAGGGSDMPDFYEKQEGAVISTAIDKYIHIFLHPNFYTDRLLVKYSQTEEVTDARDLKNDIFRTILTDTKITGLEIASSGDVPTKTGLGSSSAFAVGLYNALSAYKHKKLTPEELASYACDIEINKLRHPIGKQDQYASAYGGFNFYRFLPNNKVIVEPVNISPKKKKELNENLVLFYTGITRSADDILGEQKNNIKKSGETVSTLRKMTELAHEMRNALEDDSIDKFGELLHKGWLLKKTVASTISNSIIDKYYEIGLKNGALGGKLLGAGGGGCLLFYCEKKNQEKLKDALKDLRHIPFSFTNKKSEIIFKNE
ncbi:MAG: GHMP kinase [Candidatus Paceibacterota bacterium]